MLNKKNFNSWNPQKSAILAKAVLCGRTYDVAGRHFNISGDTARGHVNKLLCRLAGIPNDKNRPTLSQFRDMKDELITKINAEIENCPKIRVWGKHDPISV